MHYKNSEPSILVGDCCTSLDGWSSVPVELYPDNMPLVKNFQISTASNKILIRPLTLTDFMAGLFLVDALDDRGCSVYNLILPFVPGARQDRLNSCGDFLFTAKSISKEINLRNFEKVTILDPHSNVISGLIDRCVVYYPTDFSSVRIPLTTENYTGVISPDAGAEKRATEMARVLNVPLFHGWKTRDVSNGKITGFGIEQLPKLGGKYLIVDDICDGGFTFIGLNKVIVDQGANNKCDLFVTHGLFSCGVGDLLKIFGKVFCTDSILNIPVGVNVFNICKYL